MTVTYRAPTAADAAPLRAMAHAAFADTFADHFPAAPMQRYLAAAYGADGTMARDLADPAAHWRIAEADGAIVGYAKLTALDAPAPDPQPGALELRQLYLVRDRKGSGIADALMTWTIETARGLGAPELYLAVFDWNARAVAFYARHGFTDIATFPFDLGGMAAEDHIMRRAL